MNDLLPTFDASDALRPEASWALMTLRLLDVVDEHLLTIHWSGLRRSATAILGSMGGGGVAHFDGSLLSIRFTFLSPMDLVLIVDFDELGLLFDEDEFLP